MNGVGGWEGEIQADVPYNSLERSVSFNLSSSLVITPQPGKNLLLDMTFSEEC